MHSGKLKRRAKKTMPSRKGLVPLTTRQANETVGGRRAQPDMSDTGAVDPGLARPALGYDQG